MAKKKTIKQERKQELVSCVTCANADLMQWDKNPIIAQCNSKRAREVAEHQRMCERYEPSKELPKPIKHFKRQIC